MSSVFWCLRVYPVHPRSTRTMGILKGCYNFFQLILICLSSCWTTSLLSTASASPSISTTELFHWEDYTVLASMLIISCGIGVFYGYFTEKPTTGDDFLLGGSSMGTFPTALSLAARYQRFIRRNGIFA